MDSNWILPPRMISNVPVSGWRGAAMKRTWAFLLQTGQFVKNPRLLFRCQTLKQAPQCTKVDTISRKSYKEQNWSILFSIRFFSFPICNVFLTILTPPSLNVSIRGPGPSPQVRYSWNTTKKSYMNVHRTGQTDTKRHSDVDRVRLCCWEKKRKTFLKHFANYHDQNWITAGATLVLLSFKKKSYIQKRFKQYNNQIQLLLCLRRKNEATK